MLCSCLLPQQGGTDSATAKLLTFDYDVLRRIRSRLRQRGQEREGGNQQSSVATLEKNQAGLLSFLGIGKNLLQVPATGSRTAVLLFLLGQYLLRAAEKEAARKCGSATAPSWGIC